ncbi:hypothetical protein AB0I81_02540 [Nonomuraea sp. NPDC050404]|uniref:hypothetical protein n=1 Tax=Nonomuraea sp. NPDC050404 TaxID=3155783 RepID=UPI0033CA20EA
MLLRRLLPIALGAVLLTTLAPAAAAGAVADHECFSGQLTPTGDTYKMTAWGCGGGGYVDVTVRLMVGAEAGTYLCGHVFSWNGTLVGERCVKE